LLEGVSILTRRDICCEGEVVHDVKVVSVDLIMCAVLGSRTSLLIIRKNEGACATSDIRALAVDSILCETVGVAIEVDVKSMVL